MSEFAILNNEEFICHNSKIKIINNKIKVSGEIIIYTDKGCFNGFVNNIELNKGVK